MPVPVDLPTPRRPLTVSIGPVISFIQLLIFVKNVVNPVFIVVNAVFTGFSAFVIEPFAVSIISEIVLKALFCVKNVFMEVKNLLTFPPLPKVSLSILVTFGNIFESFPPINLKIFFHISRKPIINPAEAPKSAPDIAPMIVPINPKNENSPLSSFLTSTFPPAFFAPLSLNRSLLSSSDS